MILWGTDGGKIFPGDERWREMERGVEISWKPAVSGGIITMKCYKTKGCVRTFCFCREMAGKKLFCALSLIVIECIIYE